MRKIPFTSAVRCRTCGKVQKNEIFFSPYLTEEQAISKWETGKANPDIMLLPKLAEYFGVTLDHLFFVNEADHLLSEDSARELQHNADWWAGISEEDLKTTALPNYGLFTPT